MTFIFILYDILNLQNIHVPTQDEALTPFHFDDIKLKSLTILTETFGSI